MEILVPMGVTDENGQSLEQTGVGTHHLIVNHQPQWRKPSRVSFYSFTLSLSNCAVSHTGLCSYCGQRDGDEPEWGRENQILQKVLFSLEILRQKLNIAFCGYSIRKKKMHLCSSKNKAWHQQWFNRVRMKWMVKTSSEVVLILLRLPSHHLTKAIVSPMMAWPWDISTHSARAWFNTASVWKERERKKNYF